MQSFASFCCCILCKLHAALDQDHVLCLWKACVTYWVFPEPPLDLPVNAYLELGWKLHQQVQDPPSGLSPGRVPLDAALTVLILTVQFETRVSKMLYLTFGFCTHGDLTGLLRKYCLLSIP